MSVFGGGFPRAAAARAQRRARRSGWTRVLAGLVRKQVLAIRADPLSPDRGQYAFAQTLLRTVAYEMLSKRERKPRHLAAAEHLRAAFPNEGEDVAEVIAAHYLDAYDAAPRTTGRRGAARPGAGGAAPRRPARRDRGRSRGRRARLPHRARARGRRGRALGADRGGGR